MRPGERPGASIQRKVYAFSGNGTFELQVVAQDRGSFSRFAPGRLMHRPHVNDIHTSFSLGEAKASSVQPLGHLDPRAGSAISARTPTTAKAV